MNLPMILFLMSFCLDPIVINRSQYEITLRDLQILSQNKDFCRKKFEDSICVKKFIKRDKQVYHIVCGKPEVR